MIDEHKPTVPEVLPLVWAYYRKDGVALAELLLRLSKTQRRKLYRRVYPVPDRRVGEP